MKYLYAHDENIFHFAHMVLESETYETCRWRRLRRENDNSNKSDKTIY